jgi:hypothetical protein
VLRGGEVFEPVLPEVEEPDAARQLALNQFGCTRREKGLPTVRSAHDTGSVVNVEARVESLRLHRLARVEADPHLDWLALPAVFRQCLLSGQGACDSISGVREREVEAIPLHLHLNASVADESLPEQSPVLSQGPHILLTAELLQHPRRSLDIREKERDCASGELSGHAVQAARLGGRSCDRRSSTARRSCSSRSTLLTVARDVPASSASCSCVKGISPPRPS